MTTQEIRWIQRFNHFSKALSQLTNFIEKGALNELGKRGLIQSFEYTAAISNNERFEKKRQTGMSAA